MIFRRATVTSAIVALAVALCAAPDRPAMAKNDNASASQGQSKGKGKPDHAGKKYKADKGGKPDRSGKGRDGDVEIGDYRERRYDYRDEDVLDEYRRYRRDRGDLTPDYLRNPQSLPPGIAKNLQRGKPLPPGIAKKVGDNDLLRRLPRSYPDSEWYAAGDRLVEYDPVNEAIINVVENVLYGGL